MTETQFLELLTGLAKIAKPLHRNSIAIQEMETEFKELEIDSLDTLMLVIFCCELHGIAEDVGKVCNPKNARELWDFIQANKTRDIASVTSALEACA